MAPETDRSSTNGGADAGLTNSSEEGPRRSDQRGGAGGHPWPAVTFESRPWTIAADAALPRRQRLAHTGPYEAAVVPSIADRTDLGVELSSLALAEEASGEVARFDAELGQAVAPFAALLLRSESAASSRIENLTASAKAIALAELGDPTRRNANVIVANTRAMQAAIDLADQLDEQAILDMHETLLGGSHPAWVGHWRDQQVWIGGTGYGPHQADFTPPHHDRVPAAMSDLVAFMRRDDLPVLAQAAIAHAQFETIHPFPDGNGRTGRSVIHSLLRAKGLTRSVTVPVSAGLLADLDAYFAALDDYRKGHPAAIVERLADAAFSSIGNARTLVAQLRSVRSNWDDRITARHDATVWRMADLLVRQPVVDSPLVQRELEVTASNVNKAIDRLVAAGILVKVAGNHRYRKWAAGEVLAALDDFADRAGRRARPG